jgi:hypothetical protein
MKLTDKILTELIGDVEDIFGSYERYAYKSENDLIKKTSELYDGKKVLIVKNVYEIESILKESETPWVYHYSLNLNWVVFFNRLYQKMWIYNYIKEGNDLEEIFVKTRILEIIFNHVDGIIESGDKIYLVRDDVKLIQKDLRRFTLN